MRVTVLADNIGQSQNRFNPTPCTSAPFNNLDVGALPEFLREQIGRSQGLIMMIFENYQPWASGAVERAIPRFPPNLLAGAGDMNMALLPWFDDSDRECCYIIDHIDMHEGPDKHHPSRLMRLGQWRAKREPVATWIRDRGGLVEAPERPVLAIFCNEGVAGRLCRHYIGNSARWRRLEECPYWSYLDCLYILTNWDSTLEIARFNLEAKEQALFDRRDTNPIMHQTKELHRDASATLSLQESIRLHQESLRQLKRGVERVAAVSKPQWGAFFIRLESVAMQLDYYSGTATTILEQQKNLISLTFDLENIRQSEAVARINGLAFIFLPLSYVATIFGMTTLETPAFWYPVAAIPVLLVTIGAALGIQRVMAYRESRKPMPKQEILPPSSVRSGPSIEEARPSAAVENKTNAVPPPTAAPAVAIPSIRVSEEDSSASNRPEARDPNSRYRYEHLLAEPGWSPSSESSTSLGYRVSGVARVDSGGLNPKMDPSASPGALRSPSGILRHR